MRTATASNKRNSSSSSSLGSANYKQQRKSAKTSDSLPILDADDKQLVSAGQVAKISHLKQIEKLEQEEAKQEARKRQQTKANGEIAQVADGNYVFDEHRKQNHCEIEKRRRDKMNHYIMQLASVIPSFANNQSKFDKLTVLRMAVQHVKSLRSSLCSFSSFHLRPSFLSNGNLLKNLILQMASQEAQDNLFMVISCDRGKVLFVSQSSKDILNQDQNELVGQCLFDLLHKDDVSKVKEQISYFNLMPKEMLVDSKTLQPIKQNKRQSFSQLQNQSNSTPQPGARRSFFCRMRNGANSSNQPPAVVVPDGSKGSNLSNTTLNIAQASNLSTPEGKNDQGKVNNNNNNNNSNKSNNDISNNNNDNQSINGTSQLELLETNSDSLASQVNNNNLDLTQTLTSMSIIENDLKNFSSTIKNDSTIVDTINKNLSIRKPSVLEVTSKAIRNKSKTKSNSSCSISSDSSSKAESGLELGEPQSVGSSITGINQTSERLSSADSSPSSKSNFKIRNSGNPRMSSRGSNNNGSSSKKHWRYTVMHCTGYLKALTLDNDEMDDDYDYDDCNSENNSSDDEENSTSRTVNCLVAVCRRSPINRDLKPDRPLTFTCRYSMEGKFVFVDQRTTVALGYTPQQLLGTSHYAYCHKDSVNTFKECHRQCILKSEPVSSDIYQFKRANGQHLWLQTSLKSFRNPWTKFIDYIVANHTTAEGNDPHYNEGCVPTKFNQDMTGEASQSSSPASSSLSLPSMDSKKSSSPSSSSIGSSYSMESYASGASIQALLNQIDKIKSGGIKHALDFSKHKSENGLIRSGGGSTRKSNEDSGNYSDPQSCSSLSSNSAICNDYVNLQGVNHFPENTNNSSQIVAANNFAPNTACYSSSNKMNNGYRSAKSSNNPSNYQILNQQTTCQGSRINQVPNFEQTLNANQMPGGSVKIISRASGKPTRLLTNSSKQHHRVYNNQYHHYKSLPKSCSSTSSDTGNESGIWSNSGGSVYSENTSQRDGQLVEAGSRQNQVRTIISKDHQQAVLCGTIHDRSCKVDRQPSSFVMQQVEPQQMNMNSVQVPMDTQLEPIVNRVGDNYSNNLMPVTSYLSQAVSTRYNEAQHIDNNLQQNMTLEMEHQATQNVPVVWNQQETPYQNNLSSIHGAGGEQICPAAAAATTAGGGDVILMNMDVGNQNNQTMTQPTVCCQQFVNHRCCSNQQSTDLNSINLTSLLVDGDLDEDQLLDYLAGCDPETQLYNMQNNAFANI